MTDAPHHVAARTGSWSSPAIPTTPISGRPGPRRAGSTRAPIGWLVCCTSGDAGRRGPRRATRSSWPPCASASSGAAAAIIGYAGVSFLHMPDGALANDLALREQLVREIRTFRPDAVLATDPDVLFYRDGGMNHTDHRAAGIAAVDAVYPAARNPMAFPWLARSGLAAHMVRRLYLFWPNEPTVRVDITATLGPQDRRAAGPRQPDQRAREARRADPRMGAEERRSRSASRRRGASGSS